MIGSQRRRHNVFGYDERKKVKGKLCVSMLSFFSGVRFKKKKAVQDSSKLASGQAGSSVTPPRGLLMGLVCLIGFEIIDGSSGSPTPLVIYCQPKISSGALLALQRAMYLQNTASGRQSQVPDLMQEQAHDTPHDNFPFID